MSSVKNRRLHQLSEIAILLVLVVESVRGSDKAAAPDFSSYPQTYSFRYYLGNHTNAAWHLQQTNILMVSAFPSGDRYALEYFVTESGQQTSHRNCYSWAIQASNCEQLSETDL